MTNDDADAANAAEAARFTEAIRRFDEENVHDPTTELADGLPQPRELLYARRLSDWVLKLCPQASEELQLAARCQHICRWTIPRHTYAMTRAGYLRWRAELKDFHAGKAGQILQNLGYPREVIARVQALNLKSNFPADPESRVLEDALCLMFLQYQFAELAGRTTDDKMINALRKTWKKMTPTARAHALKFPRSRREESLLEQALAGT
jgi:hypothetical protein